MNTTNTTPQDTSRAEAQTVLDDEGYDGFVRALFNRSGDPSKDFTNAILGIATEVHEYMQAVDRVNAIEEAGDLYFYMIALGQVLCDFTGAECGEDLTDQDALVEGALKLAQFDQGTSSQAAAEVIRRVTELLDEAKRWLGYGSLPKKPFGVIHADTLNLVVYVIGHGQAQAVDPHEVTIVNVQKLLKRYKGMTFSADKSMNRDIAAEREVLEGAVSAAA